MLKVNDWLEVMILPGALRFTFPAVTPPPATLVLLSPRLVVSTRLPAPLRSTLISALDWTLPPPMYTEIAVLNGPPATRPMLLAWRVISESRLWYSLFRVFRSP